MENKEYIIARILIYLIAIIAIFTIGIKQDALITYSNRRIGVWILAMAFLAYLISIPIFQLMCLYDDTAHGVCYDCIFYPFTN